MKEYSNSTLKFLKILPQRILGNSSFPQVHPLAISISLLEVIIVLCEVLFKLY